MAPSGLKKALSFEAVRLASQERVQQRLPPNRMFGKICGEDRILQRSVDQIVREMMEQLEEVPKMVSQSGLQRRVIQVPKILRQDVEVVKNTTQEQTSERMGEQSRSVEVPR